MAKQMGFHGIETRRQYVRPVVAAEGDVQRRFDEVVAELGYDLQPHEDAVPQMVSQFAETLATLAGDLVRVEKLGAQGRAHARRYDWDDVAERQERVYMQAVTEHTGTAKRATKWAGQ